MLAQAHTSGYELEEFKSRWYKYEVIVNGQVYMPA